jgi:hypothetical protein
MFEAVESFKPRVVSNGRRALLFFQRQNVSQAIAKQTTIESNRVQIISSRNRVDTNTPSLRELSAA